MTGLDLDTEWAQEQIEAFFRSIAANDGLPDWWDDKARREQICALPLVIGDRTITLGAATPDDLGEWARLNRAAAANG